MDRVALLGEHRDLRAPAVRVTDQSLRTKSFSISLVVFQRMLGAPRASLQ